MKSVLKKKNMWGVAAFVVVRLSAWVGGLDILDRSPQAGVALFAAFFAAAFVRGLCALDEDGTLSSGSGYGYF